MTGSTFHIKTCGVDSILPTYARCSASPRPNGAAIASDWPDALRKWMAFAGDNATPNLLYGGSTSYERQGLRVWGWQQVDLID
jgi:hypothetical protein